MSGRYSVASRLQQRREARGKTENLEAARRNLNASPGGGTMELSGQPPTNDMDDTTNILTPARPRNGEAGRLFAPVTGSVAGLCLDLFCCEGGAGMGYALAGYEVTGVDIAAQTRYPFTLVMGDALEYLQAHGHKYDLIHASPPCQGYSHLTPEAHKGKYAKLIPQIRELLKRIGKPYVIENVAGARHELENPVMLCGSMFGLRTRRHRWFETNFPVAAPCACDHSEMPLLVTTASKASRAKRHALGIAPKSVKNAPQAYGIGWMSSDGLKEAIPPDYTRHIGEAARRHNGRAERPGPKDA